MSERAHTHRDTLALVLVMGGVTSWAVFPAVALLRDSGTDDRSVLAAALVVGCLLGAWVAASVFRAVATATVVVAGALTAAVVVGLVGYIETRQMIDLGALEGSAVLLSAVAAGAGAQLRHLGEPRRGLAAAAIVLAATGASVAVMALVDPPEDSALGSLLVALVVAAPVIGAILGALLCDEVRPRSVSGWTFTLWSSVFMIVAVADGDEFSGLVMMGGAVIAAGAALATAFTTWLVQKLRRRRALAVVVPAAQVVQR